MMNRVVLAYSGGAAASADIAALASRGTTEVVTLTLDVGADAALEAVRDRALAAGAVRAHVLDVRDEYASDYLLPSLRAGVLVYDGVRPRRALWHALTARKLDEIAALEQATPLARMDDVSDAAGLHPSGSATPAHVEVAFAHGRPTALNGVAMPLAELFGTLATIAGEHGVQPDPADVVLQTAHAEVLRAALSPDLVGLCRELGQRYAAALTGGAWFTPTRAALDAFFATAQASASGAVRLKLFEGECAAVDVTLDSAPAHEESAP